MLWDASYMENNTKIEITIGDKCGKSCDKA